MPLAVTENGTINIKGSRGSLDSIIHHFNLASTAEQFVQRVRSLDVNAIKSASVMRLRVTLVVTR